MDPGELNAMRSRRRKFVNSFYLTKSLPKKEEKERDKAAGSSTAGSNDLGSGHDRVQLRHVLHNLMSRGMSCGQDTTDE